MNSENEHIRIGDVFYADFAGSGSVQSGRRPAVVFQNNVGNKYSPNVTVFPLTSKIKKQNQPTHVIVSAESGLPRDSMVLCENPICISKERLGTYITTLSPETMSMIAEASILASGAISYMEPRVLYSVWKRAQEMNAGL